MDEIEEAPVIYQVLYLIWHPFSISIVVGKSQYSFNNDLCKCLLKL